MGVKGCIAGQNLLFLVVDTSLIPVLQQHPTACLVSTLAATAVAALFALACAGCARTTAVASDGEVLSHPAGITVVAPEGWTWTRHDRGLRLVGVEREGKGYPTVLIDVVPVSELPDDFLDGRPFEWAEGKGTFRYRSWANPLGHGDALTVHLVSEDLSIVIEVEHWSEKLFVDRRFYRKHIWPILNSIRECE